VENKQRVYTIPNLISFIRIGIILSSIFFIQNIVLFLILFVIAGFTDILDGFLARKLHQESSLGAKLDSIADLFLYMVLIAFMVIHFTDQLEQFYLLILLIIVLKCVPIVIYKIRFKEFVIVHAYLNKAVGLRLLVMPFMVLFDITTHYFVLLIVVSLVTMVEEFLIAIKSSTINRDCTGFLEIIRKTEK